MITQQRIPFLVLNDKHDWCGNEIPDGETDDKEIIVWVIEPTNGGFDEAWIRDYFQAIEHAQEILAARMDDVDEADLLEHGVSVKCRLMKTTVGAYKEVLSTEEP